LPKLTTARLILAVTALVVTYFLVSGAFNIIRSQQLRDQEAGLTSEIQDLRDRYHRLNALKDYLDSDEYIEAVARSQLGLVREGEIGLVVISNTTPTPAPDGAADEESGLWWDLFIR
jgi:cell division protein FtsB